MIVILSFFIRTAYCITTTIVPYQTFSLSYHIGLTALILIITAGFLLRSVLIPNIQVSERTWVCLGLSLYANLGLYILNYQDTNFSLYLIGLVCIFIVFVSCAFLLYFSWRQDQVSFRNQFTSYYLDLYNSSDYTDIRNFWLENFSKRNPRPLIYAVWEYPILVLASLYTLARTRLALFQTLFVVRACVLFLLGYYHLLLIYMVPLYFLTGFFSIEFIKEHFAKVYGSNALKIIGWNASVTAAIKLTPTVIKTLAAGVAVAGAGGLLSDATEHTYKTRNTANFDAQINDARENGYHFDPELVKARRWQIINTSPAQSAIGTLRNFGFAITGNPGPVQNSSDLSSLVKPLKNK